MKHIYTQMLLGRARNPLAYTNKIKALGPIAYWPQAESSGTTIVDESGNGRNGTYVGVTLGQPGIGDGRTAAGYDGATSYGNIYSASLAAAFNPREFTIAGWLKTATWTDGAVRAMTRIRKSGSGDRIDIYKDGTANTITAVYVANGVTKAVGFTFGVAPTAFTHIAVSVTLSGNAMKLFINGVQQGVTATGLGTWIVTTLDATQCVIGAISSSPVNVTNGALGHMAVFGALSAAEIASLAVVP